MKRVVIVLAVALLGGACAAAQEGALPACPAAASGPREIIRRAIENDHLNDQRARDYTYIKRQEVRRLDSHGRLKSTRTETREVVVLYGEPIERLIAKDDQPLSPKDAAKEEKRINEWMKKRKNESPEEKKKRLEKEEKDREQQRAFVKEIGEAFAFTSLPAEEVGGRAMYVIDAQPRPDFHPRTKEGKFLQKFRFRVWIDQAECQWAKLDAEVIDTVSWGWILARLHRGTRVQLEQTRVNDEVWLPLRVQVRIDVRVALLKNYNAEIAVAYRDYRKFRSEVHILSSAPPQ